ncbi:quinone oxidoreductase [Tistrella bauzanensis]|uniref:Quinone oxidoreductase n=1 Tax=Tistrella bauzanensis TaxID=657419 RepID=A0ABQ1I9S8_9PROT|nr:zinc-binding dehydrogenase [Tistrella bauzanensis]GGB30956.1 quinone oxidoreductase [Tistrella bauzanensis]
MTTAAPPPIPSETLVMRVDRPGGPEALVPAMVPLRRPGPGEVLMATRAIGVNHLDLYYRDGTLPFDAIPAPAGAPAHVPGLASVGEVLAVGAGVDRFGPGDRVAHAGPPLGAYAAHRVLPVGRLVRFPHMIPWDVGAAALLPGIAVHMMVYGLGLRLDGRTVLVRGAAGGVGLILVRWASAMGARVIAIVGTQAKAEAAREAGAEHVVIGGSAAIADAGRAVLDMTGGAGVHLVFDAIGGANFARLPALVRPFGRIVSFGQVAGPIPPLDVGVLGPQRSLGLDRPGVFAHIDDRERLREATSALFTALVEGLLSPTVAGVLPLRQAADAHRRLEARDVIGSLVLVPDA